MGALITLIVMFYMAKKVIRSINRYNFKVMLMWFFVFVPFIILLFCLDISFHEGWTRYLAFAALWLPIRWDNKMDPMVRNKSWAETHGKLA